MGGFLSSFFLPILISSLNILAVINIYVHDKVYREEKTVFKNLVLALQWMYIFWFGLEEVRALTIGGSHGLLGYNPWLYGIIYVIVGLIALISIFKYSVFKFNVITWKNKILDIIFKVIIMSVGCVPIFMFPIGFFLFLFMYWY